MITSISQAIKNFVIEWIKLIVVIATIPIASAGVPRLLMAKKARNRKVTFSKNIKVRLFNPSSKANEHCGEEYTKMAVQGKTRFNKSIARRLDGWPEAARQPFWVTNADGRTSVSCTDEEDFDLAVRRIRSTANCFLHPDCRQMIITPTESVAHPIRLGSTVNIINDGNGNVMFGRAQRKRKRCCDGSDCRCEDGGSRSTRQPKRSRRRIKRARTKYSISSNSSGTSSERSQLGESSDESHR